MSHHSLRKPGYEWPDLHQTQITTVNLQDTTTLMTGQNEDFYNDVRRQKVSSHIIIFREEIEMDQKKPIVRTAISSAFIALLLVVIVAINMILPSYDSVVSGFLGGSSQIFMKQPKGAENLDLDYTKPDYTAEEMAAVEQALNEEIVGEGIVLLKNDGNMPYASGTKFSFFSEASAEVMGNPSYDLYKSYGLSPETGLMLKEAFESRGFEVNEKLWDFYMEGEGSNYRLGIGSVNFGDAEDFSINEVPLSVLQKEGDLLNSAEGTVPVFVWGRKVGEGRDMPRSMYNHTDNPEDKAKSYLEPNSTELEILTYLNDNFEDIVLMVNASAAMELGCIQCGTRTAASYRIQCR